MLSPELSGFFAPGQKSLSLKEQPHEIETVYSAIKKMICQFYHLISVHHYNVYLILFDNSHVCQYCKKKFDEKY